MKICKCEKCGTLYDRATGQVAKTLTEEFAEIRAGVQRLREGIAEVRRMEQPNAPKADPSYDRFFGTRNRLFEGEPVPQIGERWFGSQDRGGFFGDGDNHTFVPAAADPAPQAPSWQSSRLQEAAAEPDPSFDYLFAGGKTQEAAAVIDKPNAAMNHLFGV